MTSQTNSLVNLSLKVFKVRHLLSIYQELYTNNITMHSCYRKAIEKLNIKVFKTAFSVIYGVPLGFASESLHSFYWEEPQNCKWGLRMHSSLPNQTSVLCVAM